MKNLTNKESFSDFPVEEAFDLDIFSSGTTMLHVIVHDQPVIIGFIKDNYIQDFHLLINKYPTLNITSIGCSVLRIVRRGSSSTELRNTSPKRIIHSMDILTRHLQYLLVTRPEKRYDMFLKQDFEHSRYAPLMALSSYIGISIQSLSRIRKRKCKKSTVKLQEGITLENISMA